MVAPRYDLIVVGAGPAGVAAAITAAGHGLKVAVFDENRSPGGQIYREPWRRPSRKTGDFLIGERLRAAFLRARTHGNGAQIVEYFAGSLVWAGRTVDEVDHFALDVVVDDISRRVSAPSLIIACGTTEKLMPVAGWTTPGVIGLAAATIMLKAYGVAPVGPIALAGSGPLLYAVAGGLLEKGADIAVVADQRPLRDWLMALPWLLLRPGLLMRGAGWMLRLRLDRVPVVFAAQLSRIEGEGRPTGVELRRRSGQPLRIAAAHVIAGSGLRPASELAQMLGLEGEERPEEGGWVPRLGKDRRSSVPGIFVAGDCAGIRGGAYAATSGRMAGLSAAACLGRLPAWRAKLQGALLRLRSLPEMLFGREMGRLMQPSPRLPPDYDPDVVICRCEEVRYGAIDAALQSGARSMAALKSGLRCGMGPCQGRMCGPALTEILRHRGFPASGPVRQWTARPPIKPISIGSLVGSFDYDDIKPEPGQTPTGIASSRYGGIRPR